MENKSLPEPSKSTEGHPYETWKGTKLWDTIEAAISELVENQDLKEVTSREYVVGLLAKRVSQAGFK